MSNLLRTSALLGIVACPAAALGWFLGGGRGAWPCIVLPLAVAVVSYLGSPALVLRLARARRVDAGSAPHLLALVADLATRAALPPPRVFLVDDPVPNAFVTGRAARGAALVLSSGIVRLLDERELRAVLAHEFAHVLRGDMLPASLAAAAGGLVALFAQAGSGSAPGAAPDLAVRPSGPLWWLFAPLAALLARPAASAAKEFAADRLGARLCEDPRAMASALRQLGVAAREGRDSTLATRCPATVQMMFQDPLRGGWPWRLFRTQPPRAARVRALLEAAPPAAAASAATALEQPFER